MIAVVPQIDNPRTNHKLKLVAKNDEKAPVTAVACCNGNLVAAIGTKIIIHSFDESEIAGIAFLDVFLYVTCISVVKNLLLVGDLEKSVALVAYQQDPAKLTLVSKDITPLQCWSVSCIIDETDVCCFLFRLALLLLMEIVIYMWFHTTHTTLQVLAGRGC